MAGVIHVFHGFLGSPEDFLFLQAAEVECHDLYQLGDLPTIKAEDTLIGYSMGGRIALELAARYNFQVKRLVLINAHPGLESEGAKLQRKNFEAAILERLETSSKEEFLTWWNALPIFSHDLPISVAEDRFQKSYNLFSLHLLSEQPNFLPLLAQNTDKVLFVVGLQDEKYMNLVEEKLLPHDIKVKGIEGGHRLFQKQDELLKLLREEGIL